MAPLVCAACLAVGVRRELERTDDYVIACSYCGTVDENATYRRNAVEVSGAFGTLMDDEAVSGAKFLELREKKHDDYVDTLLDVYLVDPTSRIVERSAGHFKAAARSWYNRMRTHEEFTRNLKHTSTNSDAKKVRYRLAVAVHFAIQESNIVIANNRLSRVKVSDSDSKSTFRGDGTIMAPSMVSIFTRAQALNPDHPGHLDSWSALRHTYQFYSKALMRHTLLVDVVMSQVIVLCNRIVGLSKQPWHVRISRMAAHDLKPSAQRMGRTLETAEVDDFVLDTAAWRIMADLDWVKVTEMAYNLYCAQQVVFLWRNRKSVDIAAALVIWAIQAVKQQQLAGISCWAKELCMPYGGNDNACLRRRSELRDMLVCWSTSFAAAGLQIPVIQAPAKGGVGDGLRGWSSDKRRPIPEAVMATAAAPVVANNWWVVAQTRLASRTRALPLDIEYAMAARALASAYYEQKPDKRRSRYSSPAPASAKSTASSRAPSRSPVPSSRQSSVPAMASVAHISRGLTTREAMLKRMNLAPITPPPPTPPSIEDLLATRDDSSDEDVDELEEKPSDEGVYKTDMWLHPVPPPVASLPFGFSVGPTGFSVEDESVQPQSHQKRPIYSQTGHIAKRMKKELVTIPPSPPSTSPASTVRSPSPTLKPLPSTSASPYPPSSPSLRAMSMSPTQTSTSLPESLYPIDEQESTRHIGLLLREREQYVAYNPDEERRRGAVVTPGIEAAMLSWVEEARARGVMPDTITRQYLAGLGVHGDPRRQDLGWFIRAHAHKWSPTECLLRLGIRPIEFPPHLVVHSHVELARQLGRSLDGLAPMGVTLGPEQLDQELKLLFEHGDEKLSDILATPDEAARKERIYRTQGLWQQPRAVAEGRSGKPLADSRPHYSHAPRETDGTLMSLPTGSKRINYDALRRLCATDNDSDEEVVGAVGDVLDETLWEVMTDKEDLDLDL